jgi:hypothetical protein
MIVLTCQLFATELIKVIALNYFYVQFNESGILFYFNLVIGALILGIKEII